MARRGADVTDDAVVRPCVVLAPHPDDETLGCAATVMRKLDAGTEVRIVVISDGATWPPDRAPADNIAARDAELRRACRVLGLPDAALTHLSFPETKLDTVTDALVDTVADILRASRPDELYVTSEADPHADHAALGRAARRAAAGTGVRLLAYPIWQWERPRSWRRTLAASSQPETVLTTGYVERKQQAIAVYHSQMSAAAGGEQAEGLTPGFLGHFVGEREIFFPVPVR